MAAEREEIEPFGRDLCDTISETMHSALEFDAFVFSEIGDDTCVAGRTSNRMFVECRTRYVMR